MVQLRPRGRPLQPASTSSESKEAQVPRYPGQKAGKAALRTFLGDLLSSQKAGNVLPQDDVLALVADAETVLRALPTLVEV